MARYKVERFSERSGNPYNRSESLEDRLNERANEGYKLTALTVLSNNERSTDANHGHGVDRTTLYHLVFEREERPLGPGCR